MAFEIEFNDNGEKNWWRSKYGNPIQQWFVAEAKLLGLKPDILHKREDVQDLCNLLFTPKAMKRMLEAVAVECADYPNLRYEYLRNYTELMRNIALVAQEPVGTMYWG